MEIHYLIILEDAIVDADEDKKWIKWYFTKYHFCTFYEIKTTILQLYYKFIKFILQAINSVVFNTKML